MTFYKRKIFPSHKKIGVSVVFFFFCFVLFRFAGTSSLLFSVPLLFFFKKSELLFTMPEVLPPLSLPSHPPFPHFPSSPTIPPFLWKNLFQPLIFLPPPPFRLSTKNSNWKISMGLLAQMVFEKLLNVSMIVRLVCSLFIFFFFFFFFENSSSPLFKQLTKNNPGLPTCLCQDQTKTFQFSGFSLLPSFLPSLPPSLTSSPAKNPSSSNA